MVVMAWCVKAVKRFQLIITQQSLHPDEPIINHPSRRCGSEVSVVLGSGSGGIEEIALLKLSAQVLEFEPYPTAVYKELRIRCWIISVTSSSTQLVAFFAHQDASQIYLRFGLSIMVNSPKCSNLREQRHISWKLGWRIY